MFVVVDGAPLVPHPQTASSTASNPTNTSPIPVTVTFSESVTGFTGTDTFTLTFQGWTTTGLSNAATPAQVQSALEVLPVVGTGNVHVQGALTTGFLVTFINARGNMSYDNIVANSYLAPTTSIYVNEEVNGGRAVIYVTHDIDEAIYLSDRVVVMQARPGRIKEEVTIDLPRPRWEGDIKADPRFAQLRAHLRDSLRS